MQNLVAYLIVTIAVVYAAWLFMPQAARRWLVTRIALLPLTLHLARQARQQQLRIAGLEPRLKLLRARHAAEPIRLMQETRALHAAHGIRVMTPSSFLGMLIQLPLLGALFAAVRTGLGARVRFLWVANLAQPNAPLIAIVSVLAGLSMAMQTPATSGSNMPGPWLAAETSPRPPPRFALQCNDPTRLPDLCSKSSATSPIAPAASVAPMQ